MFEIVVPDDKSLMIPGFFAFTVLMVLAMLAIKWFKRISKKEEERARLIEERMNQQNQK